jgi:hypothetical protein
LATDAARACWRRTPHDAVGDGTSRVRRMTPLATNPRTALLFSLCRAARYGGNKSDEARLLPVGLVVAR